MIGKALYQLKTEVGFGIPAVGVLTQIWYLVNFKVHVINISR